MKEAQRSFRLNVSCWLPQNTEHTEKQGKYCVIDMYILAERSINAASCPCTVQCVITMIYEH